EFTTNTKYAVENSEVVFIAVGTPSKRDGDIDMTYFKQAIREVVREFDGYKIQSYDPIATKNTKSLNFNNLLIK
ncbi:MAG: UDP-glucose 6-dehydrogenase, partial [Candidatus Pacebacteria bacterium]|nr:UDP-glucose 6-dehydrogenase [Candidatus Paceibacterota bacterium]